MMSRSKAWIGCSIDAGKGKWFVQLVGPGPLFDRRILASAFAGDEETAIASALCQCGIGDVEGVATVWGQELPPTTYGMIRARQATDGFLGALGRCGEAVDRLTHQLRLL
jgi:hypothetical protein